MMNQAETWMIIILPDPSNKDITSSAFINDMIRVTSANEQNKITWMFGNTKIPSAVTKHHWSFDLISTSCS